MDYRALLAAPLAAAAMNASSADALRQPAGWMAGASYAWPQGATHEAGVAPETEASGQRALTVKAIGTRTLHEIGSIGQYAMGHAGKRVRFSAQVMATGVDGWAGLVVGSGLPAAVAAAGHAGRRCDAAARRRRVPAVVRRQRGGRHPGRRRWRGQRRPRAGRQRPGLGARRQARGRRARRARHDAALRGRGRRGDPGAAAEASSRCAPRRRRRRRTSRCSERRPIEETDHGLPSPSDRPARRRRDERRRRRPSHARRLARTRRAHRLGRTRPRPRLAGTATRSASIRPARRAARPA